MQWSIQKEIKPLHVISEALSAMNMNDESFTAFGRVLTHFPNVSALCLLKNVEKTPGSKCALGGVRRAKVAAKSGLAGPLVTGLT